MQKTILGDNAGKTKLAAYVRWRRGFHSLVEWLLVLLMFIGGVVGIRSLVVWCWFVDGVIYFLLVVWFPFSCRVVWFSVPVVWRPFVGGVYTVHRRSSFRLLVVWFPFVGRVASVR